MRLSAKRNRAIGGSGICVAARGSIAVLIRILITPHGRIAWALYTRCAVSLSLARPTCEGYPHHLTEISQGCQRASHGGHSGNFRDLLHLPARASARWNTTWIQTRIHFSQTVYIFHADLERRPRRRRGGWRCAERGGLHTAAPSQRWSGRSRPGVRLAGSHPWSGPAMKRRSCAGCPARNRSDTDGAPAPVARTHTGFPGAAAA